MIQALERRQRHRYQAAEKSSAGTGIRSSGTDAPNTERKTRGGSHLESVRHRSHRHCLARNSCRPPKHACLIIEEIFWALAGCPAVVWQASIVTERPLSGYGGANGEDRNPDGWGGLPRPECRDPSCRSPVSRPRL